MHIIIQHTFCAIGYVLPFDTYEYALYTTPPYQPHCKNANFCLLLCLKYTQALIKTELVSKKAELNIFEISESYVIFGHFHIIKVSAFYLLSQNWVVYFHGALQLFAYRVSQWQLSQIALISRT